VTLGDAEGEPLDPTEAYLPTCTKLLFLVETELLRLIRICPSAILLAACCCRRHYSLVRTLAPKFRIGFIRSRAARDVGLA
jgi:hypothetical protein